MSDDERDERARGFGFVDHANMVRLMAKGGLHIVETREPSWLVKDFNVLYRVAERALRALRAEADPIAAYCDLKAQLERLRPAFTDTEEVRKARGGE